MSTMAENVIATRAENRPLMLERSHYDSWQSHMLLYIQGKEHGIQLLDSVKNGLFKFGTVKVPATPNTYTSTRDRILDDFTPKEKIRELVKRSQKENGLQIGEWTADERKAANLD
ncbi:hypothetical protein Tco_1309992 [Tanacetum coccineum]